jgi:hypothetical protein
VKTHTDIPYKLIWPYDRCGLTQIRPYIKWMFRPHHIFMRPTANTALYHMMNKILELVVFSQDLLVTQYEKP